MNALALMVQETLRRNPHGGDLYVFRGKSGKLIKVLWHDGIGMSLYLKRLERGRFVWPQTSDGAVSITQSTGAIPFEALSALGPTPKYLPLLSAEIR
jgi:transposase